MDFGIKPFALPPATCCFIMVRIDVALPAQIQNLLTITSCCVPDVDASLGGVAVPLAPTDQTRYRSSAPTPPTPESSAGSSIKVTRAPVSVARATSKSAITTCGSRPHNSA